MPDVTSELLTSEQAADMLGVSNATVLRANRVGSLASSGTSSDGDPLFSRDAVELYRRRRTELFRGAVRTGSPATSKPAPKPEEPPAEPATPPVERASEPEPEPQRHTAKEPEPEHETAVHATVSEARGTPEPEPKPRAHEPVPHRAPRRHQPPPTTLPEIDREEWLDEWTTTLEWLDRLALALVPIENAAAAPAAHHYDPVPLAADPPTFEDVPVAEALPAAEPISLTVNLAVRPVVSFAILKEIGLALRARPGVLEARLDRLDSGAAWFVLRHDDSAPLETSARSALEPLGFSVTPSGDGSFEVVQDSSGQTG